MAELSLDIIKNNRTASSGVRTSDPVQEGLSFFSVSLYGHGQNSGGRGHCDVIHWFANWCLSSSATSLTFRLSEAGKLKPDWTQMSLLVATGGIALRTQGEYETRPGHHSQDSYGSFS